MLGSISNMRLKNYKKYLKLLRRFCKIQQIKLVIEKKSTSGTRYVGQHRSIFIDGSETDSTKIAGLLHELGHVLDEYTASKGQLKFLLNAYPAFYAETPGVKQEEEVVQAEVRAWKYGIVIARVVQIPLGKWYFKEKNKSLKSYRTYLT